MELVSLNEAEKGELAFHLDAMMQHKGWRAVGWGVVRHDFSEPISYDFCFHLVCHVTQDNGSELAKRLGCVNFRD